MKTKKYFFLLLLFIHLLACNDKQTYNQIIDQKSGQEILVGRVDKNVFLQQPYSKWFNSQYEQYSPNLKIFNNKKLPDFDLTIVLGTWCRDSRLEVPRMFKILDSLKIKQNKITIYCVDRNKKALHYNIENLNIKRVPTFIFYIDGQEIGRIVEHPIKSLEEDMYEILF